MYEKVFADPLNDHITSSSFRMERFTLREKVDSYREEPIKKRFLYGLSILSPFMLLYFMIGLQYLTPLTFAASVITFVVLGIIVLYYYMQTLQQEVITLMLCDRHDWVFNPEKDYRRAHKMAQLFPDAFDRGDIDKNSFDNQIWGTIGDDDEISFWSGNFEYEITHYNALDDRSVPEMRRTRINGQVVPAQDVYFPSINKLINFLKTGEQRDENKTIYQRQAFILELGGIMPYSFSLFRQGIKRDMETESVEFNKLFNIILHDKSKQSKLEVVDALSPAVQTRLIDFAKTYNIDCILFQHNCMVILFKDEVWQTKHTNFLKNVTIDERDVALFDDTLRQMTELPLEMRKYLA